MKRLLVAVILAVVLTLTFATPAFAGPPEDKPGNMPGKAANLGLQNALNHLWWGLVMGNAHMACPPACVGAWFRLNDVIKGEPPAKPHWASGPK